MMKGELLPHVVPDVAAVLPLRGGMPITGKFEDLVQRCAQLEGENAVLAYKLRRMRRTIRRLGQDNAFIQRRLREHIKRKEGSATTFAALAVGKPIEQPCRPPGELEHMNHPKEVNVVSRGITLVETVSSATASSAVPPPKASSAASSPVATVANNGHNGRTSSVKLETLQRNKKVVVGRDDVMPRTNSSDHINL